MGRGRPKSPIKFAARMRPRAGIPKCPAYLSPAAKKKWAEIVKNLKNAGVLTLVDGDILGSYCEYWATWFEANEKIVKVGSVYKGPNGGFVQNPYLSIRRNAAKDMAKLAERLGLDPLSRQRLQPDDQQEKANPKSKFFQNREG